MPSIRRQQHRDRLASAHRAAEVESPRYVEQSEARRALSAMTDSELAEWLEVCDARSNRAGLANGAARAWKALLVDARSEQERRGSPVGRRQPTRELQ